METRFLHAPGGIQLSTFQTLKKEALALLEEEPKQIIVGHGENAPKIDFTGVQFILSLSKSCQSRNVTLKLHPATYELFMSTLADAGLYDGSDSDDAISSLIEKVK